MDVDAAPVHLRGYVEVADLGEGSATDLWFRWMRICMVQRSGRATDRRVTLRRRSARAVRVEAVEAGNEHMIAFARLPIVSKHDRARNVPECRAWIRAYLPRQGAGANSG